MHEQTVLSKQLILILEVFHFEGLNSKEGKLHVIHIAGQYY